MYFDVSTGVPASQTPLILGGEVSQWSDTYCFEQQCGASNGPTPVGAALFPPSADAAFSASIGGMLWPRALVAATAFYNFNASVSPFDPAFVAAVFALNDALAARGSLVCPSNCSCDQLTACGVPYLQPAPPVQGATVAGATCAVGGAAPAAAAAVGGVEVQQKWVVNADGSIALAANASLCLTDPGPSVYPLTLQPCAPTPTTWRHDPVTSEVVQTATGLCMDLRGVDGAIGTYACGSGQGLQQPNQMWVVDAVSGILASFENGDCATASAAPAIAA